MKPSPTSLRSRLILLVFLCMCPVFGLTVWHDVQQLRQREKSIRQEAERVLRQAASSIAQVVEGTRQIMLPLAWSKEVQALDTGRSSRLYADVLGSSDRYANIGLVNRDGLIISSGIDYKGGVTVADRPWFLHLQKMREFSAGTYQVGRISGKPAINFAMPVAGQPDKEPIACVFVALKLQALQDCIATSELLPGSILAVLDRNGTILARHPADPRYVGQTSPFWEKVAPSLLNGSSATARGRGIDGIERDFTIIPVPNCGKDLFIGMGITAEALLAEERSTFKRQLLLLGCLTALSLVASWLLADLSVVRQANQLARVSEQFAAGEYSVRAPETGSAGELRRLAVSFNTMASRIQNHHAELEETVQRRTEQIRKTNLALEGEISERKKAEAQGLLLNAALQAASNLVVITNREGFIEWANRAFLAVTGATESEVIGKSMGAVTGSGKHPKEFYQALWSTILAGKVWSGEVINRRKDSSLYTAELTINPICDEKGAIVHFVGIMVDTTRRKKLEEQLLHMQRVEAIGTLAVGVAHDLNNILAPMMMVTSLLRDKLTDEASREMLNMMDSSTRRGADIVKHLLAFSRNSASVRSLVQLRHLVHEQVKLMTETFPKDIQIREESARDIWPVIADPTQIHQVLLNLCVNARDAIPGRGSITLQLRNTNIEPGDLSIIAQASPGPYVELRVTDTGHGINSEIRHRIFDPFFTTKELGKGTGLGLSTVLGIVREHGGFVMVESEPGKGACFKVFLPAKPSASMNSQGGSPVAPPKGEGQLILVVDDEAAIRTAVSFTLRRAGYRVLQANDGEEALQVMKQQGNSVALVITDLMMPKMNGFELIRQLHSISPELRIIGSSGLHAMIDRSSLAGLKLSGTLIKPYEPDTLLKLVRETL